MDWISIAWIAGGLFGSLAIGLIIGRIVASLKYPNPDKPQIFTTRQALIVLAAVVVAVGLIIFAVLYQPKKSASSSDPFGEGEYFDGYTDGDKMPQDGDIDPEGYGDGTDVETDGMDGILPGGGDEGGAGEGGEGGGEETSTAQNEADVKTNPVT